LSTPKLTLEILQQRFLQGLQKRISQLQSDIESIERRGPGEGSLDKMMHAFHSLAGIGGTYGFPEVTRTARAGELACQSAMENGDLQTIRAAFDALAAAAKTALLRRIDV
jgi:chemotaxis protein histidine kinase CheA